MSAWHRLFWRVGLTEKKGPPDEYATAMRLAIRRLRLAEIQMREAGSLEQLDLGRTALQQALAEVQHLVRQAKADRGVPLRSIAETEAMYLRLLGHLGSHRRLRRHLPAGDPVRDSARLPGHESGPAQGKHAGEGHAGVSDPGGVPVLQD